MTLFDIWDRVANLWKILFRKFQDLLIEYNQDWRIWTFFVVFTVVFVFVAPRLSTIGERDASEFDEGIWDGIWAVFLGFCLMSYLVYAAFTGQHEFPAWIAYVALIGWTILGYIFLTKLEKRLRK